MAITPMQAQTLSQLEIGLLKSFEAQIDKQLPDKFINGRAVIDHLEFGKMTEKVLAGLKDLYQNAGWTVTYHDEQIGGKWFEFKPRPRPKP